MGDARTDHGTHVSIHRLRNPALLQYIAKTAEIVEIRPLVLHQLLPWLSPRNRRHYLLVIILDTIPEVKRFLT